MVRHGFPAVARNYGLWKAGKVLRGGELGLSRSVAGSEGGTEESIIFTGFTLAEISPSGTSLQEMRSPLQSEPIDLVTLSKSGLEIVETGQKVLWAPETPPIALLKPNIGSI